MNWGDKEPHKTAEHIAFAVTKFYQIFEHINFVKSIKGD